MLLNFQCIIQNIILKITKCSTISSACLPACLPAVRPVVLVLWLQFFYATKLITSDLQNCCSKECLSTVPGVSFYLLLVSFHLQITYRKIRNFPVGIKKLVGKVSINLLLMSCKVRVCIISMIINVPTCCRSCTLKQIDLTSVFVSTAALLYQADVNRHLHNIQMSLLFGASRSLESFKKIN